MSNSSYSLERVRQDFPIFKQKIYGKSLIYLDSAASAQKPYCVIESMQDLLANRYANVHRGLYFLSDNITEAYENARAIVQKFLNAHSDQEIIFTKNATEGVNLVAYSWAMEHLKEGDEIILSVLEHHSNIVPWHFLRERLGVRLKFIPLNAEKQFDMLAFKEAFNERTKLVAMTHVSNVLGTILPIKEIARYAHERGAYILVDGAQAAARLPIDVQDLDVDWYVFTGHKIYGPTGIGILYGKKELLGHMRPFLGGGQMISDVTCGDISYASGPHRFEAGTPAIVEAIALGEAINYVNSWGVSQIEEHDKKLVRYAYEHLKKISTLTLYGDEKNNAGILSFQLGNMHPHDIATFLDRQGIAIRAGTHCAQPLLNSLGCSAICRASLAMYNSRSDIDQLIISLDKAKRFFDA